MTEKGPFEKQVDAVSEVLGLMLKAHWDKGVADSSKRLEALFKTYSDRMLSDNERIWR